MCDECEECTAKSPLPCKPTSGGTVVGTHSAGAAPLSLSSPLPTDDVVAPKGNDGTTLRAKSKLLCSRLITPNNLLATNIAILPS